MPKKPGPLPKPIKLKGEGPSASEQVIQDRGAGLTQTEAAMKDYQEGRTLTSEDLWKKVDAGPKTDELTPLQTSTALLQARIEILVEEAVATSAIEGITISRQAARQAVPKALDAQYSLELPGRQE